MENFTAFANARAIISNADQKDLIYPDFAPFTVSET